MRSAFHFFSMVLFCLVAVGCTNKEPEERAAFIAWLQTQVIDAPDARLPDLDETQRDALGDYDNQYAELRAVDSVVQEQILNLANAFEHEALTSLAQLRSRQDMLRADRQTLVTTQQALHQAQAHAQAERAKWEQPADLLPVYARAYDKIVTQPVAVLDALTKTALAVLDDTLRVADFLAQHENQITIVDDSASVQDPSVQQELNQLLDILNGHAEALRRAQSQLQTLQLH